MIDMKEKILHIAYCLSITKKNGRFIKYVGEEYCQFRGALLGCYAELTKKSVVVFVTIDSLRSDGSFGWHYTLIGDTGGRLEFERHDAAYMPDIVVNRTQDQLYEHPALAVAPWCIYNNFQIVQYGNKMVSADRLGEYMPRSLVVRDIKSQKEEIAAMLKICTQLVLKPVRENGGRGIRIIEEIDDLGADSAPFVLQEFIETSGGVDGIVGGRHDVRLYVIDSSLVLMSVRRPKAGEFLANTAQGGSIDFLPAASIPLELEQVAKRVIGRIDNQEHKYFISLDFFYSGSKWLLIEVNDQPGMPAEYQTSEAGAIYKLFARSVQGASDDY